MAAVTGVAGSTIEVPSRIDWARKYPPLLTIAIAGAIALVVLPSALNLPQSNPTETLEYAPVPPDDENQNNNQGNVSALGLGKSAGIGSSNAKGKGVGEETTTTTQPAAQGGGKRTVTRRHAGKKSETPVAPGVSCVGSPPRQSFDILSPPCVPFFDSDNGCDTYSVGVTCDEIKLVIFMDGGINYTNGSGAPNSDRNVAPSDRKIFDLWKSKEQNNLDNGLAKEKEEHLTLDGFRTWQDYFNARFQTYGRRVHFYVYYARPEDNTPENRRINATDILTKIKPFAVVSFASEGAEDDFLKEMARKGVLNFGSFGLRTEEFFNKFPRMIWSYLPSVEQQVQTYGAYLCSQVVGKPPVLAGEDVQSRNALPEELGGNDGIRKLGMISTSDPNWAGLLKMATDVKKKVAGCDGEIALEGQFPTCCLAQDNGENPDYAATQMAQFKSQGITTILWAGGMNGNYGKAATSIDYYPEWIVVGDGFLDANGPMIYSQNTSAFDRHAITVTPQVVEPNIEQQTCFRAYREVNDKTPGADLGYTCEFYVNLFQFFVGVQVAGPYINPSSIDKGFHAIPQHESGSPQTPACFYLPGDYTCVKDAQAEWWDASGRPPGSNTPGCWRSIEGGQRYHHELHPWRTGNINEKITFNPDNEPCNGYSASSRLNLT